MFEKVAKYFGLLVPALLLCGLMYDVGFINYFDPNMFTLFTLWDHTLFVVHSLPLVLLIVGFASAIMLLAGAAIFSFEFPKRFVRLPSKSVTRNERLAIVLFSLGVVLLFGAVSSNYERMGALMEAWGLNAGGFSFVEFAVFGIGICVAVLFCWGEDVARVSLILVGYAAVLFFCYDLGLLYGRDFIRHECESNQVTEIDDHSFPALLVRGGEKGIMVLDMKNRHVIFERIDRIKSITSNGHCG
jgi:hypothetical protein